MRLILLGAPGSGKGTIAAELKNKYNILHISTGDIFRVNMKEMTPLGIEAKKYIDKGALVPDSITIAMVTDRLGLPDCQDGFVLDGFPRTIGQAESLELILSHMGVTLSAAVYLEIADESIKVRVSGRRVCITCGASYNLSYKPTQQPDVCDVCGGQVIQRDDDQPETVLRRLQTYHEKTQPLIDYYESRHQLIIINNESDFTVTMAQIEKEFTRRQIS